jgi:hypothetical protein
MKFNPYPWLCIVALLGISFWVRVTLIENSELGFICADTPGAPICVTRWTFMSFIHYKGISYFVLFLGVLAAATRSGMLGFITGAIGAVGLIVYAKDHAAVGFLLGILTLARTQLEDYRYQHGSGQQQADDRPA